MVAKSITMKQRFNVPLDQVFPVFNQHTTLIPYYDLTSLVFSPWSIHE